MRTTFISMLKTWKNVMTKPGEQTFAAERSKSSATLKTALAWILLAGVIAALLDILLTTLTEMWVIPLDEIDFPEPSSITMMMPFQPIMNLRLRYFFLYQEFRKLYAGCGYILACLTLLLNLSTASFITSLITSLKKFPAGNRPSPKAY